MSSPLPSRLFINGKAVAGDGGVMTVINPGTEEILTEPRGASAAQIQAAIAVASRIRAGTVNINGGVLSAYASSGGWHSSGIGRERGVEGLRIYQQIQGMNIIGA